MVTSRLYVDEEFWEAKLPALRKAVSPEHVIVFGSRARGDPNAGDLDLIVVSERFEGMRWAGRGAEVRRALGITGVDILCYTPEEFEKKRTEEGIVAQACREGAWVAGKNLIADMEEKSAAEDADGTHPLFRILDRARNSPEPEIRIRHQRFLAALDYWYRRWPMAYQNDIKGRLFHDEQVYHACYELLLYAYFYAIKQLWVGVQRKPDLLIGLNRNHPLFEVEIVTRIEFEEVRATERWKNRLTRALNQSLQQVPDGFALSLHLEASAPEELQQGRLLARLPDFADRIETWLSKLERIPSHEYELRLPDLRATVAAGFYPGVRLGSPIAFWSGPVWAVDPPQRLLLNGLERKARECSPELVGGLPFFVAYGHADVLCGMDIETAVQALYGRYVITMPVGPGAPSDAEPRVEVRPDGLFTKTDDNGQPLNTHVSGVLWVVLEGLESVSLQFFHNPYAQHPLDPNLFAGIPQFGPDGGWDETQQRVVRMDRLTLGGRPWPAF